MNRLQLLKTVLTLCFFSCCTTQLTHAARWFDDFSDGSITDGSPLTWTFNEIGGTPGSYDASSGDLVLSAPGDPMPSIPTHPSDNSLAPSVDMIFADTFARTQAITIPDDPMFQARGNAGILVRWDPAAANGYVVLLDHQSEIEVIRIDGGAIASLDIQANTGVDTLTDAVMEVEMVGSQLSVFAWHPDDPKPTTPVSTVTDSTYTTGRVGLLFNEDFDGHAGVFRFAAAQDSPFLAGDFDGDTDVDSIDLAQWQGDFGLNRDSDSDFDSDSDGVDFLAWQSNFGEGTPSPLLTTIPEPSSFCLLSMGLVSYLYLRRRHRR